MGRLAQIQQQLSAQHAARREQASLERQLLEQVAKTASEGIAKVDLSPISRAIESIPKPEKVDLGPIYARLETISRQVQMCMDAMASEGKATRSSMPKLEKVDLSQIYSDLQWLKTVVSLDRKEDAAEPAPKTSWNFVIERDRNGFIKSIKAE